MCSVCDNHDDDEVVDAMCRQGCVVGVGERSVAVLQQSILDA